jgi:ankyrin repeat protein
MNAGADVHAETHHFSDPSRRQMTPLMLAAMAGHADVSQVLIHAGARTGVTTVYYNSETPLMRAADGGHLDAVRVLLEAGADPRGSGGPENLDALTRAERRGHREVAELIRNSMA